MKKGMVSISTLVVTLLTIIGFVIVLFLYYQIKWTGNINREVCHQSVIYRATVPSTAGAKELIPLKCKTDKICITGGGLFSSGKCKEFSGATGVTTMKVKNIEQIEKIISESIVDCWSMMGEGRVSLFSQYYAEKWGFGSVYPTCVVCNRIAFDLDGLKKAGITKEKLGEMDIAKYMMTHAVPDKDVSYYRYLLEEGDAGLSIDNNMFYDFASASDAEKQKAAEFLKDKQISGEDFVIEELPEETDSSKELGIVFMQISAPDHGETFGNFMSGSLSMFGLAWWNKPGTFFASSTVKSPYLFTKLASGKSVFAKGNGKLVSKVALKPFTIAAIAAAVVVAAAQQVNVAGNRAVTAGYCGDVMAGGEAKSGCSSIKTIDYSEKSLGEMCGVIESLP